MGEVVFVDFAAARSQDVRNLVCFSYTLFFQSVSDITSPRLNYFFFFFSTEREKENYRIKIEIIIFRKIFKIF